MEGLALNLATAADVQFNLMRFIMATLFTSATGEERPSYFREETEPEDIQMSIRGLLEANQAVVNATSTLLGDTVIWRRQDAPINSSVPGEQRQGLINAPFNKETLFGHKPMSAVVSETEQDKLNRAIISISSSQYRRPSYSQRGYPASNSS